MTDEGASPETSIIIYARRALFLNTGSGLTSLEFAGTCTSTGLKWQFTCSPTFICYVAPLTMQYGVGDVKDRAELVAKPRSAHHTTEAVNMPVSVQLCNVHRGTFLN